MHSNSFVSNASSSFLICMLSAGRVLFFWPKDFTFVCPTEIAEFGRLNTEFSERDAILLGGSTDYVFVHLAWRQHKHEGVAQRTTFIVDAQSIKCGSQS